MQVLKEDFKRPVFSLVIFDYHTVDRMKMSVFFHDLCVFCAKITKKALKLKKINNIHIGCLPA